MEPSKPEHVESRGPALSEGPAARKGARPDPIALVLINQPEEGPERLHLESDDLQELRQVIRRAGYRAVLVDMEDDVDRISHAVVVYQPTIIVNLVDHVYEQKSGAAAIASLLELYGYVYTGGESRVLQDCQSWSRTRILLEHAGLPSLAAPSDRHLHACVLGNDILEFLPICETLTIEGNETVEPCSLPDPIIERIEELSAQVWNCLGLRDVAQIDYDLSPAGRLSIVRVRSMVDICGPGFRVAANARDGGFAGAIAELCRLCHLRLSPEELAAHPLPSPRMGASATRDSETQEADPV